MQNSYQPDLGLASKFLSKLDPQATSWTFQTFDDSGGGDRTLARIFHGNLEEHGQTLAALQGRGAGVFVTVNETDGTGRKKENITRVRAFFIDLDGSPLDPVREWGEPHIICRTSEGRYHTYWLVNDCPLDDFSSIQRRLIRTFEGDKQVHDLPRVLRLPGFWHLKDEPYMVNMIDTEASPEPFNYSELTSKINILQSDPNTSHQSALEGNSRITTSNLETTTDEVWELLSHIPSDCGYRDWLTVLMGLHNRYRGSNEGLQIADEWSRKGNKYKPGEVAQKWAGFEFGRGTSWASVPALARDNGADLSAIGRNHKSQQSDYRSATSDGEPRPNAPLEQPELSHDALATDLGSDSFDADARYVASWGKWLFWTDTCWQKDDKLLHLTRVREFVRERADQYTDWADEQANKHSEAQGKKLRDLASRDAQNVRSKTTVAAIESLARSNPASVAQADTFDRHLTLLGTPGGTVDLRTGILRPAARNDMITKLTAYTPAEPGAKPERWLTFLDEIFDGDTDLVAFMQRATGYALTGLTNEHKLLFLYGTGRNGKSVFLNTLVHIWADYSRRAAAETFLNSKGDKHATGLAGLQGARLVAGSELPVGKTWDESVIKDLTGGDRMTARFMRGDFFDFDPQLTLMIAGNNQPSFRGIDEAIRARVILIPFLVTIPPERRDMQLPEKLKDEGPEILRWAIEGAQRWFETGLNVPEKVLKASTEYLDGEDTFGQFLDEKTAPDLVAFYKQSKLYEDFNLWCGEQGLHTWSQNSFRKAMQTRGYEKIKRNQGVGYVGLKAV